MRYRRFSDSWTIDSPQHDASDSPAGCGSAHGHVITEGRRINLPRCACLSSGALRGLNAEPNLQLKPAKSAWSER